MECKQHRLPVEYECTRHACQHSSLACRYCLIDHYNHPDLIKHIGTSLPSRSQSPKAAKAAFSQLKARLVQRLQGQLQLAEQIINKQPELLPKITERANVLEAAITKMFSGLYEEESQKEKLPSFPKPKSLTRAQNGYRFSKSLKSRLLQIRDGMRLVSVKKFNGEGDNTVGLIEPAIDILGNASISLKVGEVAYVGIALKNIAEVNEFGFKDPESHGCHMVTWDGWVFSHNNRSYNNQRIGFIYCHNDVVTISYRASEGKLCFDKNRGEQKFVLPLDTTNIDFFQGNVHFSVALWTAGNEVQILDKY